MQLKKLGVDKDKIILWGHSLGTVVALETARNNDCTGCNTQSPIKEIKSAAIDVYNFFCNRMRFGFMARFAKKHIEKYEFYSKTG